ncbi:MAG: radical SAM protein [Lysobacterales bacterium]
MNNFLNIDQYLNWLRRRQYARVIEDPVLQQGLSNNGAAGVVLAAAMVGQGKTQSGLTAARQCLAGSVSPLTPAWAIKLVAQVLLAEGQTQHAGAWFEQAAGLDPDDPETVEGLARCQLPDYLAPEAGNENRTFLRHAPREVSGPSAQYVYAIDIVGTCNLRCPTCPVGNAPLGDRTRGFMSPEMFHEVVAKILDERPSSDPQIWLFNWGEPLLHPQLPTFIEHLNQVGLRSYLSSNLNIRKGLEAMVRANPTDLKVSLSGASEATYQQTHVRGKFAVVEANMRELRRLLDRHQATTNVWVGHHIYRHNQHEIGDMAALCQELNFAHQPVMAFYQPLEALVDIAEGGDEATKPVLDLLIEPPQRYIKRFANVRDQRFDCELRFNQTVINHDGSVALCCSTYTRANQLAVGFLDEPHEQLQARKYAHSFCATCYRHGLQHAPTRVHDVE